MIKIQDPADQKVYWVPPGGQIEPGETPEQTAVRETLEETGYHVRAIPNTDYAKEYDFQWNGFTYRCKTYFVGASLEDAMKEKATDSTNILETAWIEDSQLPLLLDYDEHIRDGVLRVLQCLKEGNT